MAFIIVSGEKHSDPAGGRARQPRMGHLMKNAVALMISSGGTAGLGVIFWGVATHLAKPADVGRASAEVAAMVLLANLSQLSFTSTLERFLPVAGQQTRSFAVRAYTMTIGCAFVLAIGYVAVGFGHSFLPSSFGWRVVFVFAVALWTIFILQDSVLIGLRASKWVPVENILYALAKLMLLPLLIATSKGQGVFLAWSIPVALTIFVVNWFLFRHRIPEYQRREGETGKLPGVRELVVLAGAQYATLILGVASTSLVTLIILERLGAVANAYYYVPAQVAAGPLLLAGGIVRSFLVEASHEPNAVRRHARETTRALLIVVVPCVVFGIVLAPQILSVFGRSYAAHGTTLLRMMLLALPGLTVTTLYSAFAWIDRRVWWTTLRELVSAAIYFTVLFATIRHVGILSVGIASLVSAGAQGVFFLPVTIRRYRRTVDIEPGGAGPVAAV